MVNKNITWRAASAAFATTLVVASPVECDASFTNAIYAANIFSYDHSTLERIYTTHESSFSDTISSILALFDENNDSMVFVHKRLSYILDEDELRQDEVQLNKESFIGLKDFVNRNIIPNINKASIFVSDDGSCNLTYSSEHRKFYVKFIDRINAYYITDKYVEDILYNRNQGYSKIYDLGKYVGNI